MKKRILVGEINDGSDRQDQQVRFELLVLLRETVALRRFRGFSIGCVDRCEPHDNVRIVALCTRTALDGNLGPDRALRHA